MTIRTIAYFISPHGFGHAARATAVMQALQRLMPEVRFLVFTSVPKWFFADQGVTNLRYCHTVHDVGLVQTTPFQEDLSATLQQLDHIYPYKTNLVNRTINLLKEESTDLAICDIAPIGLVAARQLGIPSLLIENFTWNWIYQPFTADEPGFEFFIEHFRSLFPLADSHIQAEPICKPNGKALKVEQLISRYFRTPAGQVRQTLGIKNNQKMVLLSFGGIRDQFSSWDFLQKYPTARFVIGGVSENIQNKENVILLPHNSPFYHPDLIQAADIIIGKAGYSTLAEVRLAGKPFAFISRKNNAESAVLSRYILEHLPSIEITQNDYLTHNWIDQMPEILSLLPAAPAEVNGADLVADYILNELAYSVKISPSRNFTQSRSNQ